MCKKNKTVWKKTGLAVVLLLGLFALFALPKTQMKQTYFEPLFDFVKKHGYEYTFEPLARQEGAPEVPIYNETVWHALRVGTEELWVYFDDSNRAKQLSEQFCQGEENGKVIYVGLRFIICYHGADESILQMMDEWQAEYPA